MDTQNPLFAKFDQVLGKTTPTTTTGPVSSRADEIRALDTSPSPSKKFGDDPSFKASVGGVATVVPNVLKTIGNIPSDIANIGHTAIDSTAGQIGESREVATDIYKDRGLKEGTKDIVSGFGDTLTKIGEAPGKAVVSARDKNDLLEHLSPLQEATIKQRDTIVDKIKDAQKTGKDTTHLIKALKYTLETLADINNQIGTKEDRRNEDIASITRVAKYPIEHPAQIAIAAEGLEPETQASISTKIEPVTSTIENPITKLANKGKSLISKPEPTFENAISEAQKIKNPTSKYTPTKSEKLYKSDSVKTTGKGPFRKEVASPKPTGEDEVLADLVSQKKISSSNLPNENISAIKTEARAIDSGIDEFVNRPELNRPFNGKMLDKMTDKIMTEAKASRVFISDSAEQKAYQDVIDIFKEEASKNPYNSAGLRKTNKAFNARMEDLLSEDIYAAEEAGRSSSITQARIRAAKAVRSGSSDFLAEGIDKSQISSTLKILHPDEATPFIDSAKNFEKVEDFVKNARSKMEDKILKDTYRAEKRRIARSMEKGMSFDEALKKEGISIDVDSDLKDIWNAAHTDVSATGGSVYKTQLQKEARLLNAADEIAYNARGTLNKTDLKKFFEAHPNVKKTLQFLGTAAGLKGGWDFLTGD